MTTRTAPVSPGHRAGRVALLWPKEHGAYGQLLFPLGTALVIGSRSLAALALAAACIAAFIGHEALLTLLGQRGGRVARERRHDALFSLVLCGALSGLFGAWAIARMASPDRVFVLLPAALAAVLGVFIAAGREHSTAGEIVAAVALSSCGVPVAVGGGAPIGRALICWLVFAASFTVATLAVRSTIARVKGPARSSVVGSGFSRISSRFSRISSGTWLAPSVIAMALLAAGRGWIPPLVVFALLPVCGLALGVSVFPPHPRHLRAVGWSLVTATAVTAILLAVAP